MKAVIFTEGGEGAGFGHVLRCSAIKSAFEEAGISAELLVQGDPSVARVLGRRGYTASAWRDGCAVRAAEGADIAVIDSYLAGPSVYRAIASAVRHCLYLDDNGRIAYPRGTVINYNAYGPAMRYPRRSGMEYLLGPSYAPLRREFLNVPARSVRQKIRKALVLFGGADCAGMTVKVLEFLSDSYPGMRKTAVIGAANRCADDIIRIRSGNVKLVRGAGPAEMRTLMRDCDIAFTAGGVTLYELARTGTPAVAFCTAPNQERNVRAMAAAGAVRTAELRRGGIDTASLVRAISGLQPFPARKRMSEAGMLLVDGRGAARIARYARSLLMSERITVRPAVSGDMTAVHRLSNEPAVRASSINTSRITPAGHRKWFEERLRDPDCLFLAAEYLGGFVGQVRFALGKKDAVVSISVSGKMRGTGAGRAILEKALSSFRRGYPGAGVLAYIKKDNIPSRRLFESCGFVRIGEPKVNGRKMLLYRDSGRPGKRSVA